LCYRDTPEQYRFVRERIAAKRLINSLTIDENTEISMCARNVWKIKCHNYQVFTMNRKMHFSSSSNKYQTQV
jgi:hypothetical protein